jgi:sRNA-binding regulator protein Hfq
MVFVGYHKEYVIYLLKSNIEYNIALQNGIKLKTNITILSEQFKIKYQNRRKRNNVYPEHDRSLSRQGTGTSIKHGGVKLVLKSTCDVNLLSKLSIIF